MPAINPQYLAHKCIEENTVIAQEDIKWAIAVDMSGNIVTTPGAYVYGFATSDEVTGDPVCLETKGECIGICGTPFTKETDLAIDAAGKLAPAAAGDQIVGRALEDVTTVDLYTIIQKTEEGTKA